MTPFAGKVVAFSSPGAFSYSGGDWWSNLRIKGQNGVDIFFACVAPETNRFYAFGQELGYFIYPLIALNAGFNPAPYNIHTISIERRGPLNMRLATASEISQINQLINLEEAGFAVLPESEKENVRAIFKSTIPKL